MDSTLLDLVVALSHMNRVHTISGRDRDSQMIPGAWTQSSVANPAYGTRVPARLNLPRAEHGMTVRRLGRCRAEHRLAERLGGGDGAAEAKQERYAALPLHSETGGPFNYCFG